MINSIEYNYGKFNIIEEKISEFLCELGSDIFRKFLEWLDDDICNSRKNKISLRSSIKVMLHQSIFNSSSLEFFYLFFI